MILAAFLIIPGLCYAIASGFYAVRADWPMAAVYFGYAWAQCGLVALEIMKAR